MTAQTCGSAFYSGTEKSSPISTHFYANFWKKYNKINKYHYLNDEICTRVRYLTGVTIAIKKLITHGNNLKICKIIVHV